MSTAEERRGWVDLMKPEHRVFALRWLAGAETGTPEWLAFSEMINALDTHIAFGHDPEDGAS